MIRLVHLYLFTLGLFLIIGVMVACAFALIAPVVLLLDAATHYSHWCALGFLAYPVWIYAVVAAASVTWEKIEDVFVRY